MASGAASANEATLQQGIPLHAKRTPLANSGRSQCQTAKS
jgi:hypothetical protein